MKKFILFISISLIFFSCRKESVNPYALPDSYSNQPVGRSANDLLSASKYTTLNIQVQYMPGYRLDTSAVSQVSTWLSNLCNKPGGITISQSQIASVNDSLTPAKVELLEKQNRTAYTSGNTLSLYILITDGYDTSITTLGFSFRNTSICLFGKNLYDHSGGIGQISRIVLQMSVLEHELGHLLGLVNLGSSMQQPHQDVDHNNHCINPKCLMYYAIEVHKGIGTFAGIPVLDSNCISDLHANGGK